MSNTKPHIKLMSKTYCGRKLEGLEVVSPDAFFEDKRREVEFCAVCVGALKAHYNNSVRPRR